jgi:hypothetical protein
VEKSKRRAIDRIVQVVVGWKIDWRGSGPIARQRVEEVQARAPIRVLVNLPEGKIAQRG